MSEELKTEQKSISPHSANVRKIQDMLGDLKKELVLVLPKHLTPDRLVRIALTQLKSNKKLWECEAKSFVAAVMTAAQIGLEPDGILGHAYIVPYWDGKDKIYKAQFIPGYKGLIKLARNSGEIQSISTHEVCKNDKFDFAYGLDERLEHVPARGDRGEIQFFYSVAKFKDGGYQIEVMSVEEIEKIRDNVENYKAFKAGKIKSSTWNDNFVEMGRKTTIRRISKYLPLSVQKAAILDGMAEGGKLVNINELGEFTIDGEGKEVDDAKQVEHKPANLAEFEATLEQSKPEPAEITIDEAKQKEFDAAFEKHKKEETKLSKLKKEPEQMGLVP